MKDRQIKVSEKDARILELYCFFNQVSNKKVISDLISKHIEPQIPKQIKVSKDFKLQVTK